LINGDKVEKGGYLTKRGHAVKNWKRRWFVMKDPTLCYYKKPNDTTPAGIIILDDILTIISEKNIYKDVRPSDRPNYWFEIMTKKSNYLVAADSEQEMLDWVEALEFVISNRDFLRHSQEIPSGMQNFYEEDDDIEIIKKSDSSKELHDSLTNAMNSIENTLAVLDDDTSSFQVVEKSPRGLPPDPHSINGELAESSFEMIGNGTKS